MSLWRIVMRVAILVLVLWSFLTAAVRHDHWYIVFVIGFFAGVVFGVWATTDEQAKALERDGGDS